MLVTEWILSYYGNITVLDDSYIYMVVHDTSRARCNANNMVILWYFLLEYYIVKCHVFVHLPSAHVDQNNKNGQHSALSLCTVIEAAKVLVFPGLSRRLNDVINNQLKKTDQQIIHVTNKTSGKNKNLCLTCAPNACWHVCKAYQLLMCKENLWWELAEVNRGYIKHSPCWVHFLNLLSFNKHPFPPN